ncbi:MAG: hypothetical protein GY729_14845 [Desulfobacteraceae bacterium]|nr:hypothetical protein [Desulfobacteraceae bacterium]
MKNLQINFKPWNLFLITFILFVSTSLAMASPKPSGMITQISGSASYVDIKTSQGAPLKPFMKLYEGDKVTLEDKAQVQLILFANGSKSTWKGPVTFVVKKTKAVPVGNTAYKPTVSSMPDVVTKEVRRIAKIVDPSRMQKAGAQVVRGNETESTQEEPLPSVELDPSEEREINLARNTYDSLIKESAKNDITPELFLFSVLADYDQFKEMGTLINTMRKKQPENPTIRQLEVWLEEQM